jgi:hypothetical protein
MSDQKKRFEQKARRLEVEVHEQYRADLEYLAKHKRRRKLICGEMSDRQISP